MSALKQTKCKQGHLYTPDSTYLAPNGLRTCRICRDARTKVWYAKNRAGILIAAKKKRGGLPPTEERSQQTRAVHLLRSYGMLPSDYDRMVQEQDGRCAICRKSPDEIGDGRPLYVDHDHDSGKVRGLLCNLCNQALGRLKDNTAYTRSALAYLIRSAAATSLLGKWDIRGLSLAREVADWSKDPSTRVGCYLADSQHRPLSFGFNGFPRGISDDARLFDRTIKYQIVIHAEANAILQANHNLEGATAYVYPLPPCSQCASFLIQKGIARVVSPVNTNPRLADSIKLGEALLKEAGVAIVQVSEERMSYILS